MALKMTGSVLIFLKAIVVAGGCPTSLERAIS
jgi:hypothetical protein